MANVTSLLDRAIYTYADVDRINRLRSGTARRWLEGYTRKGTRYEPVLRPEATGSDLATWGEMVEARLLAQFRGRQVPVQRMRPAIARLRQEFGDYPLARAEPWLNVTGRELVLEVQDEFDLGDDLRFVVLRDNQFLLTPTTERFHVSVEYEHEEARRMRPQEVAASVVMDPARAFGQPAVRNVRTTSLASDFNGGADIAEIARLYALTSQQVEDALRFELLAESSTTHAA